MGLGERRVRALERSVFLEEVGRIWRVFVWVSEGLFVVGVRVFELFLFF